MLLSNGLPKKEYRITSNDIKHLKEMGLIEEEKITILSNNREYVIIKIKESRISLSKDIARLIKIADINR